MGDWNGDGKDTIGVWDRSTATFYLRNSNTPGPPDVVVRYGASSYVPLVGDWNGDGKTRSGCGIRRRPRSICATAQHAGSGGHGRCTSASAPTGRSSATSAVSGRDGIGVVGKPFPSPPPLAHLFVVLAQQQHRRQRPTSRSRSARARTAFVAGDWNGDGNDGVGVWDPSSGTFYLRNTASGGAPDITVRFGTNGVRPVVGDWNGDGKTTVGYLRRRRMAPSEQQHRRCARPRVPFRRPRPVAGGRATGSGRAATASGCGIRRRARFFLRSTASAGPVEITMRFGTSGYFPMAGDWTGAGHAGVGMWDRATRASTYGRR